MDDVLGAVRTAMGRLGMTQAQVAREAGMSAATLTQILSGTYPADPSRQLEKLAAWVRAVAEREGVVGKMPVAPAFVATPTAERIMAALGYAQMAGDMAVIYGGAGLGKTTAAREYARRYPSVWLATMHPACSGVAMALEEVAMALGVRDLPTGAAKTLRLIIQRVAGSGGLIIVDEAQHLSAQALDALRTVHDATGVGMALMGNEMVFARLTGGNRAPYLDRLYSRIGKRVRLVEPMERDVRALADAFGITGGALDMLERVARKAGALRNVVKVARLAAMMAGEAQVEGRHVAAAWQDLQGA